MNVKLLSVTEKTEYAIRNTLQSIENAIIYCSFFEKGDLQQELEEMIQRFLKRVEKKINDNY